MQCGCSQVRIPHQANYCGLDWIGLDPFGLNLIRGLDWIQIHALFKYNTKMDYSWAFELKGRINPSSLITLRAD